MTRARQAVLERSGNPASASVEDATQRAFDQFGLDIADIETEAAAYTATSSDWASPAPTTKSDALTRIASAVATLLGTPIP